MYKYWGFGLHIASEIEFPELLPSDFTDPDITITLGKIPASLEGEGILNRAFSSLGKDEYLLNIKNVCGYYASYGNKIIVEPATGIDEQSVRLFLLGTVIAAVLYQRGNIPLHAAAIIKDRKLILFAGDSGAGKSTLLAHLATRGYEIFTDDICVVRHHSIENNKILGTASYPMIKLWDDAISQLDNNTFNRDFKVRPKLPKYGQFFYDTFNAQSFPIDKIFILSPQNDVNGISINTIITTEAFREVEKQAYKHQLISSAKSRGAYFSLMTHLTNTVPILKVTRPLSGAGVELLSDAIEKSL